MRWNTYLVWSCTFASEQFCPSANDQNSIWVTVLENGWTFHNGQCIAKVDGSGKNLAAEKSCQLLGGRLFVPRTEKHAKNLFKFLGPNQAAIIGVMSSTAKNVASVPAYRKYETFDGGDLMTNFSKNVTNLDEETSCVFALNNKFERRSCNYSDPGVIVCAIDATATTDKNGCTKACRYPLMCNVETKTCIDPCPKGFVTTNLQCVSL